MLCDCISLFVLLNQAIEGEAAIMMSGTLVAPDQSVMYFHDSLQKVFLAIAAVKTAQGSERKSIVASARNLYEIADGEWKDVLKRPTNSQDRMFLMLQFSRANRELTELELQFIIPEEFRRYGRRKRKMKS